jgi:hypothetical protein
LKNLKGIDQLGYIGIDGRIILKWILKKQGFEDVDWIHLAQSWI